MTYRKSVSKIWKYIHSSETEAKPVTHMILKDTCICIWLNFDLALKELKKCMEQFFAIIATLKSVFPVQTPIFSLIDYPGAGHKISYYCLELDVQAFLLIFIA